MKKLLILLIILSSCLTHSTRLFASHGMGGEITWTCLPGGQFKFQMKFYRDCNGIPGPPSVTMFTTVPGVPSIPLALFDQNDISPDGIASNGTTVCPTCTAGNGSNPIPGLVEEFIYQSAPVNLPGVPPAVGWVFSVSDCCRSNSLTNITGAGGIGYQNRAIMFPYSGTNTLPCFDSSPYFAEKPSTIICTGYMFKYNPNAVDPELDSLAYSWGQPLSDVGSPIPFAPGYSVTSQLPSPTQNINNIAATIDASTGEISFKSFTGGYFATMVKVAAYKCGIKVAEVYREMNVVLVNGCAPISGGGPNTPPTVNPPFYNPSTGLQTEYRDTVYAGDTVNFTLSVLDFNQFNNGTPQTITMEGSGAEFGAGFTNPNAGCILPPCATVGPNGLPKTFAIAGQVTFNWVTTCDHVNGFDTLCARTFNSYNFVIKATDNYCPANASNVSTFSIVVLAPPKLEAPVLRCASVNLDGSVSLSWTKPAVRDSQDIFHSYEIYAALAAGGPWTLVDSVLGAYLAPGSYSYTQTAASLASIFGTNAQQQSIFYHIKTTSGCSGDSISNPGNILKTIKLGVTLNGVNAAVLNWNALSTPPLSSHASKYRIYRQYPVGGAWTLIDSTSLLTYTDTITKQFCSDSVTYRVELPDSSGCISVSSLDTIHVNNPAPVVNIIPAAPAFCTGSTVQITCTTPGLTYLWSNGALTAATTVNAAGTYTVTITLNGGCTATGLVNVTENLLPTPTITGNVVVCSGACATFNAGPGYSSYLWSTGQTTQTITVCTPGIYTATVTDANGCSNFDAESLTVIALPTPVITGDSTICQGATTVIGPGVYSSYQWSPNAGSVTTQTITASVSGTYTVTVTNGSGCQSSDAIQVIVSPLPSPNILGDNSICVGTSTTFDATNPAYTSYLWSNGWATPTITVNTANTYTVTVTDGNGCSNTDNVVLAVNANPVPVIIGDNSICQGQNTIWDAGAGYTYQWSNGIFTQTNTVNTAGPYTVTVTDGNGCTGTATQNLTVSANPVPVITGITEVCQGINTTLNAGAGYAGYQWSANAGSATTQTINTGIAGTYTVTVTNAGTLCTGTTSATLIVDALPQPVISGSLDFCQGFNTTLSANAGYTNYLWSGGSTNDSITINSAITVTVTVTDGNGCINSTSATTVVNPNPVPNITGTPTTCQGLTTPIDAGVGYSGYLWSTGATSQILNIGVAGPVTVTVSDVNGCVGTDNINITVYALPTAAVSGVDTICNGQATSIQMNFAGPGPYSYTYFDGSSNQGPFSTGAASVNIPVSPTSTTAYTLVTVTNANCTGTVSGTANISVTPLPTAQILGTTAICDGSSTNISINFTGVGPYTYSYTAGATVYGPFTTNNDPEIISVTPGSTTTYGLTPTVTGFGCVGATNAATATVTVNDLPTAIITGDNTICAGVATQLIVTFVGTGPYTYSYSNGTNTFPISSSTNPDTVFVMPNITTSYTLVSIGDANCAGTSFSGSADVTVNPLPTAVMSGTASICDGTNTDLSIAFTGTGPYTYSYNNGATVFGPFTTNQNPVLINVAPAVNTTYTPTTISDANCPSNGSGNASITVIPLPTSTLSGSTEICRGSTASMSLVFTGTPPFEYIYADGSGTTFGPFTTGGYSTPVNVTPNNSTNYHLTYLTGSGCPGTPSGVVDIVVNNIPDATLALSGDDVLCDGESSEFTINFVGVAPYTYSYSDGSNTYGPFNTSSNPEIIPVTPTATSNYTLITYSDDKCPGTMAGTAPVTVNPLPVATVSGTPSICDGSTTSFTVGFTGTAPFTYTYFNGTSNVGPIVTSNNPEIISVSPNLTTSYNVVTVSDANCVGSAAGVATVTVNQIPDAVLTGDAEICYGDVTNLNIVFTGVAPFTYTYSNGTNNVGPFTTSTNPLIVPVSPNATSNYTLVTINDAHCPGTLAGTADVIVNPLPQPVITGDFEICDGESSVLYAPAGNTAYLWSNGLTSSSIITTTPGIVTVMVTDNNGCIGTSPAINFIVNQTPVVSFTNDTSLTCEIPEINFFNLSSFPSGSEFLWDFGDNTTSNLSNPSHIYNVPGNYTVTLTITTGAECIATSAQSVEIMFYPLPEAKFAANPTVTNVFNSRVEFTDQSANAVTWLWKMGDESESEIQNPYHYYSDIGEFKVILTVTNVAGCVDQYEEVIVVNPFYIPNAFTPNADGINDYFFDAGYVLDVQSFKMVIVNRWGESVYVGDDYTKFWNGLDKSGNSAPQGVYVYTIYVTTKGGKEHQFNGTVSLIR